MLILIIISYFNVIVIHREPQKRATLFLITTLAFLCGFLYFLYQWKQEGITLQKVNKIYHFTLTVSPHCLVKLKPCINSTFWSQSSQCVQSNRLFTTFTETCHFHDQLWCQLRYFTNCRRHRLTARQKREADGEIHKTDRSSPASHISIICFLIVVTMTLSTQQAAKS